MSLSSIDENVIEAGDFLKNFREDRRKLHCLQCFTESLELVQWIRTETQGEQ